MTVRTIESKYQSIEQSEGDGARVRRAIGNYTKRRFDPFLLMDHFNSDGQNGFPQHPHKGQETISYILSGAFAHEDFTGSKGILYPGDLQFMTAGKGIVHSEMPVPFDGSNNIGIQLWVDLPNHLKNTNPRYRDLKEWEIPEVVEQDGKLTIKVISGKSYGVESVKELAYTPIDYYYMKMKPGAHFEQQVKPDFNYFLYVLDGNSLDLNGNSIKKHDITFFNRDGDTIVGKHNGKDDKIIEFVLIGGQVQNQDSIQHGPFVAETLEEIRNAFVDFQYGRNGFEKIKTWKPVLNEYGLISQDIIDNKLGGSWEKRQRQKAKWLKENKPQVF
jgi:redox-sensitive bicupin YhaK (pirin superfamily)